MRSGACFLNPRRGVAHVRRFDTPRGPAMRKPSQLHQNGYAISRDLAPVLVSTEKLKPLGRETRRHPRRQLGKLAASLDEFGFVLPIIIDLDGQVVAGWGLVLAARQLGLPQVPAVTITDLDEA